MNGCRAAVGAGPGVEATGWIAATFGAAVRLAGGGHGPVGRRRQERPSGGATRPPRPAGGPGGASGPAAPWRSTRTAAPKRVARVAEPSHPLLDMNYTVTLHYRSFHCAV